MKAIEVAGTVNCQGQLSPNEPLMLGSDRRVRVIILIAEDFDTDPDDTSIESIREGIRQGWHEAMTGQTYPISQLWNGIDQFQAGEVLGDQVPKILSREISKIYLFLSLD